MTKDAQVQHEVTVGVTPDEAFRAFTERLRAWWPREYTWSGPALEDIGIEPREGGFCYERGPFGFRCDWGRVTAWDPGHRLAFLWQIGMHREPLPDPARASCVAVRFLPLAGGRCSVALVHSQFDRHGDAGAEYAAALAEPQGWPHILRRYAAYVGG